MERYKTAAAQAKSKGDDRKARMHERIVKVREPRATRALCRRPARCRRPRSAPASPSSNTRTPSAPTKRGKRWISRSCPFRQVFTPSLWRRALLGDVPQSRRAAGRRIRVPPAQRGVGGSLWYPPDTPLCAPSPRLPAHPGRGDASRRAERGRGAGGGHEAGQPGGPRGGGRRRGNKGQGIFWGAWDPLSASPRNGARGALRRGRSCPRGGCVAFSP